METNYGTGPDGLAGNDDCGTLSSWFVFSALGFYPVPGKTDYIIGSPIFEKTKITFGENELIISAENTSAIMKYIESATLNGEKIEMPYLNHFDLIKGATVELKMTDAPTAWAETK